jgi:hypothetical protein
MDCKSSIESETGDTCDDAYPLSKGAVLGDDVSVCPPPSWALTDCTTDGSASNDCNSETMDSTCAAVRLDACALGAAAKRSEHETISPIDPRTMVRNEGNVRTAVIENFFKRTI